MNDTSKSKQKIPDLQNKEAIPATVHLALGHKFMMSMITQNPTILSLFCLCNRFPGKKQTGFQAKSSNLVYPGRKQAHVSQQSALWQCPTAAKLHTQVNPAQICVGNPSCLACLVLVDHKPCS